MNDLQLSLNIKKKVKNLTIVPYTMIKVIGHQIIQEASDRHTPKHLLVAKSLKMDILLVTSPLCKIFCFRTNLKKTGV